MGLEAGRNFRFFFCTTLQLANHFSDIPTVEPIRLHILGNVEIIYDLSDFIQEPMFPRKEFVKCIKDFSLHSV